MLRLNLLLLALAVACGLGVVSSQHEARKLFVELEGEREATRRIEVEWGRLQLEQSALAMHSRVEMLASQFLRMQTPPASRVRLVDPRGGPQP
jgi:cell division protein FtsL